ncbi:hypothetical protein G7046_g4940 [Stylonectria norvegica]|nr:hypothetical protein G7046_g4940 [Stylonectria norvegica]
MRRTVVVMTRPSKGSPHDRERWIRSRATHAADEAPSASSSKSLKDAQAYLGQLEKAPTKGADHGQNHNEMDVRRSGCSRRGSVSVLAGRNGGACPGAEPPPTQLPPFAAVVGSKLPRADRVPSGPGRRSRDTSYMDDGPMDIEATTIVLNLRARLRQSPSQPSPSSLSRTAES